MLEVYLDPISVNSRKVLAGLELMGTEFKFHHIDYFAGHHKRPEYLKINPHATVPTAVDGDCHITESNAILQYAGDLCPDSKYYPKDLKQRSAVNRWLLWETSIWFPSCYVYLIQNVVQPLKGEKGSQELVDAEAPQWHRHAEIIDEQLGKTKWITGDNVTIADIAIASPMQVWRSQKLPVDSYPNFRRWVDQIEALDCWKKTQGAVNKGLSIGASHTATFEEVPNGKTNGNTNGHSNGASLSPAVKDFPKEVISTFNYTKPGLTEIYFYETEKAKSAHEPGDDPHEMTITNSWDRVDEFTADKHGFSVHNFKTGYSAEWENEQNVRKDFYPDVVEFLKKTVGAKDVLVFDHTIRTNKNANKPTTDEKNTSQRAPVMLVHCDYTTNSAPLRVQQLLPSTPLFHYLDPSSTSTSPHKPCANRYAFFNVWLPLHHPVYNNPLAMLSHPSTVPSDFQTLHLRYRDRDGENYVIKHREGQEWVYFPGMGTDTCILLKTFDSEDGEGRARWIGHSAFKDPSEKEGMPLRESVEIRTIAFF